MDARTIFSIGILLLMIIICVLVLYLFKVYMKNNNLDGNTTEETKKSKSYKTGNVLDLVQWLGKNAEETGVDSKYVYYDNVFFKIPFIGELFGKEAEGTAFLTQETGDVVNRVTSIFINSRELDYDGCKAELSKLYGKAQNEREEPYAEVNGGAVTSCDFISEACAFRLSKDSKRDYIDLVIEKE